MGASRSKECGDECKARKSNSNSIVRKGRKFRGGSVFGSSCIRLACSSGGSADSVQIPCHRNKEKNLDTQVVDQKGAESCHENSHCCIKVGAEQSSGFGIEDGGESRVHDISDAYSQSFNNSRSLLSRFNLFPSGLSFRMSRETGSGSSRDNISSTEFPILGTEGEIREVNQSSEVLTNVHASTSEQGSYSNQQNIEFACDIACSDKPRPNISMPTQNNYVDIDSILQQPAERRNGNREPIEHNVQFTRSLSVGRLRDRVLRRSSASDLTVLPMQLDGGLININSNITVNNAERPPPSNENNNITPAALSINPQSNTPSVIARGHDHIIESLLPRGTRYHDVLEHRSNFLERRRRIRSQVRALQRLGNRFENLSGHERSCIMTGHHRTGRCTCRAGTRVENSTDGSTARGSISRIVMLEEALFEVLDEMHQQSVVLSAQPSISSIASAPAPSEVVESLPIKLHSIWPTNHSDNVAQCHVCLLEYEQGDKIRVLPCHHEFHKTCIDKWLKEIHRVCPLCRGDICRPDTSHLESQI